jgi:DNA primase
MNTPQLFPPNDKSYLEFNGIGERATEIWHYTNKNGQTMFLKYRRDFINKETKEPNRDYLPVSRINDQWDKHLNWQGNLPLYKVHELLTTKKPILIVEGEWACSSAQKLLPDYFVTTWSGGCRNWRSTNWKTLKDKKDITFWPDNDETGLNSIQHITRWLSDRINAESKIVKIPNGLPEKWDLADLERKKIGDDIDIRKLLREAEPVKKYNYEDIATDIENKRWVYLKKSRKLYWDKYKKTFEHKDTINELYLRDYDLKRQATKELHKQDIEVCDRTAFWPTDEERLYEDGLVYLNVYKRKQFPPLKTNTTKEDVEPFRNHLRILSNGDEIAFNLLEDTIAHDLQRPEVNRIWAILIQGLEGVGKSVLFEVMTKLLGENNVAWV